MKNKSSRYLGVVILFFLLLSASIGSFLGANKCFSSGNYLDYNVIFMLRG